MNERRHRKRRALETNIYHEKELRWHPSLIVLSLIICTVSNMEKLPVGWTVERGRFIVLFLFFLCVSREYELPYGTYDMTWTESATIPATQKAEKEKAILFYDRTLR